ncbi:putative non-specific serine/threonine protein kinase [Helianthus annuus]|nr:putative non-specific serine/threonine protein kinase [Helianthus annuus]
MITKHVYFHSIRIVHSIPPSIPSYQTLPNGIIDYEEFAAATSHLNKVYKEDSIYSAFSYFDNDGSGCMTVNEIQQSCEELGYRWCTTQVEDIIKEADPNNVSSYSFQRKFYLVVEILYCPN